MRALLMHPDRDFDLSADPPACHEALTQDLELATVWGVMAAGDPLLLEIARRAVLAPLTDPAAIAYRQDALRDCLAHPDVPRALYALSGEALSAARRVWGPFSRDTPRTMLSYAHAKMEILVAHLRQLRALVDEHAGAVRSEALCRLCATLAEELSEDYFTRVDRDLLALRFKDGMMAGVRLGAGNAGTDYTLRLPREQGLVGRIFDRSGLSFTIPERDTGGFEALGRLEDRTVAVVAHVLSQAVEHVQGFFSMLRAEIGFYVGCLNLHDTLTSHGLQTVLPTVGARGENALATRGLYDAPLAITIGPRAVANDLAADGRTLVVLTGANQGGKSTFLRSVGVAHLMAQAGMFVCADEMTLSAAPAVFTHYKREEDDTMRSGKLDEELARMSQIADHIAAGDLLLCNESFAATNEREGSQIARGVIDALQHERVRVLFVTHLFELADGLRREAHPAHLFLRAERTDDGSRTYRVAPGDPLSTSYGADAYRAIFKHNPETVPARQPG